ncbi:MULTISPECIES: MotA/TolQ/ExbB proton channel family protein [unclassified Oceanobacter]|jgi:biopolymer transport protein ExbB|uniref:MotA/TolQ/ExbB proton channel family protein n=1 Tax=unclassified Oceanobacter TaxID=2620260 RepID=UPI0026E1DB3C|nr:MULTISPECIES: MotA/TolQ/ExbB proton channel family protein [unclassified Oceanobacter]MDO6681784.1 MotA/TolQ/ExbB proton channel family protein [Oceanobacter sp. 5_MG-2023]MDP2506616.1 MotA/TolQ/ExbB proton channel family protein [Oceanobacter sp. 3_MG-2023]MDP2548937.1 MotA/TolQ/ExbB proton channel family protein [Oceanobacter sp. 4_MG-2023]MDP2609679.1 MotA/TolQ/ExbB proton channel family protein [Oceanobacter sp. 1_MG-2023]MDP2613397.1 MotA/TolQ/ExbB proton channel family protein [Oceano
MDQLQTFIHSLGGPVNAILLVLSFVASTLILAKLWQFFRHRSGSKSRVNEALNHLANGEQSQALLATRNHPAPSLALIGKFLELRKTPSLPEAALREETLRLARIEVGKLTQGLRPLEVIANIAPLLGLFGTVLGMIEAFQAMEAAGSKVDPAVLSGGIWQALLTTAGGLAVAIPVSMIHSALERKSELQTGELQDVIDRLFFLHATQKLDADTAPASYELAAQRA